MVSKLLLAVQEAILRTRDEPSLSGLLEKYEDIRKGLGFHKAPGIYGAFPTDPYSHTPSGQGARQPGMTGMVKEEILTRQRELGYTVENGQLVFDFVLLDRTEFLTDPLRFLYWNVNGSKVAMELPAGCIAFTVCQVPIIIQSSADNRIEIHYTDGRSHPVEGHVLDIQNSRHILQRDGKVDHLDVFVS
jgi:hypothetical protein